MAKHSSFSSPLLATHVLTFHMLVPHLCTVPALRRLVGQITEGQAPSEPGMRSSFLAIRINRGWEWAMRQVKVHDDVVFAVCVTPYQEDNVFLSSILCCPVRRTSDGPRSLFCFSVLYTPSKDYILCLKNPSRTPYLYGPGRLKIKVMW